MIYGNHQFLLFILALLIATSFSADAETIDTAHSYPHAIGSYLSFYQEDGTALNPTESLQKFYNGQFIKSDKSVLNFSMAENPVWIAFEVNNSSALAVKRNLCIEAPWLDKINIYLITNNQTVMQYEMGDSYPFKERPLDERYFSINHDFDTGLTTILVRFETPDPLVIPMFFSSEAEHHERNLQQAYFYGIIYGAVLSLIAYNFILFITLRLRRYLYYSIHLATFLLANMAYTGHGYQWFWSESVAWQQWIQPIALYSFGLSGLLFATQFLNSKQLYPRIHKTVITIAGTFIALLLFALLIQNQTLSDLFALTFITSYAWLMLILGLVSLHHGNKSARFFLIATFTSATSASISTAAVWNIIPFTDMTFHAVEIGIVFDSVFLALALSHLFRVINKEKLEAETLARLDPLTSLKNRRAFNEYADLLWSNSLRNHLGISIIMLDIDKFKNINDRYGHNAGDKILIQLSKLLESKDRAGDVLARWGGEEFIILLPYTEEEVAIKIAERLRKKVSTTSMDILDKKINITCSFGVASNSHPNQSINEVIAQSDKFLYLAKKTGRNRVCSSRDEATQNQGDDSALDDESHSSFPQDDSTQTGSRFD